MSPSQASFMYDRDGANQRRMSSFLHSENDIEEEDETEQLEVSIVDVRFYVAIHYFNEYYIKTINDLFMFCY